MKKSSNDGEETVDADKNQQLIKSDELTNDGSNNADMEMADESKKSEHECHSVGDDEIQDKQADSSDAKVTMDTETSAATAAISKALLNIISNFHLRHVFFSSRFVLVIYKY